MSNLAFRKFEKKTAILSTVLAHQFTSYDIFKLKKNDKNRWKIVSINT